MLAQMHANNAINSDSQKRRSFVAPLLAAGYGERWACKKNESRHGGGKKVNRGPQERRRNQSLLMVAVSKLGCWLTNKKPVGLRAAKQAVPFSNRSAQQGARADRCASAHL
jgi:hypothetical protein